MNIYCAIGSNDYREQQGAKPFYGPKQKFKAKYPTNFNVQKIDRDPF